MPFRSHVNKCCNKCCSIKLVIIFLLSSPSAFNESRYKNIILLFTTKTEVLLDGDARMFTRCPAFHLSLSIVSHFGGAIVFYFFVFLNKLSTMLFHARRWESRVYKAINKFHDFFFCPSCPFPALLPEFSSFSTSSLFYACWPTVTAFFQLISFSLGSISIIQERFSSWDVWKLIHQHLALNWVFKSWNYGFSKNVYGTSKIGLWWSIWWWSLLIARGNRQQLLRHAIIDHRNAAWL